MADVKISGMTAASALTGAEVLPVVQSAANVKATAQQVVDAAMTTGLTRQALGSINTNTTIDWSAGSYVTATIGGALTFTFSNPAPTGKACVAYLQLTNGGSAVITWPVSVTWSGGTAPTLSASGVDLLRFYTQDNGTTWFGTAENDEALPAATTTSYGAVELATVAECQAGTDTTRATTPEGVAAAIAALGLAQPLTTVRTTRQSSALSAASAGETKFQFRDIVRAGLLACKTDIGDELILFPPLTHPFLTGAWFSTGTGNPPSKGVGSNLFGGAFTASTVLNSIGAVNIPSGATAGQEGIWYANSFTARDGSAVGDGYLMWGLVGFPDASYGSGATGAVCRMGLYASGSLPTSGARASAASCVLEYNTTTSDTNWLLAIHNGTNVDTADTGLAFTAQKDYFYMIHSPRGGSSTYAYIANLTDGTSGSTSLARNTGSTALSRYSGVLTRTTTARNTRFACQFILHGGQI